MAFGYRHPDGAHIISHIIYIHTYIYINKQTNLFYK